MGRTMEYRHRFTSMYDVGQYIKNAKVKHKYRCSSTSKAKDRQDWTLSESLPAALKLTESGWMPTGGLDDMVSAITDQVQELTANIRREALSVSGSRVNMNRAISGHPKAMYGRRHDLAKVPKQGVTLVVNVCAA